MKKLISALALVAASSFTFAQNTTLILPVSAGGLIHRLGEELKPGLEQAVGTPVVIDFKPGGAGIVGAKHLAEKKGPDITMLIGAAQRWSGTEFNQLDDLKPVAFLGTIPGVIIAKPSRDYSNYAQFIEYSKKNKTSYAIIGASANVQLFRDIHAKYGVAPAEIPYKAGGQVVADVLGGHVDVGMTVIDSVIPLIEQGKLIPLAVFASRRSSLLPNTPTLNELGIHTKTETKYYNNIFLWVNKSADPAKVEQFQKNLFQFLGSPEAEAIMKNMGIQFGNRSFKNAEKTLKLIIED